MKSIDHFYHIGPAVLRVGNNDILVGLASYAGSKKDCEDCVPHCDDNEYSTYMNVARFREWIKNTIYGR